MIIRCQNSSKGRILPSITKDNIKNLNLMNTSQYRESNINNFLTNRSQQSFQLESQTQKLNNGIQTNDSDRVTGNVVQQYLNLCNKIELNQVKSGRNTERKLEEGKQHSPFKKNVRQKQRSEDLQLNNLLIDKNLLNKKQGNRMEFNQLKKKKLQYRGLKNKKNILVSKLSREQSLSLKELDNKLIKQKNKVNLMMFKNQRVYSFLQQEQWTLKQLQHSESRMEQRFNDLVNQL